MDKKLKIFFSYIFFLNYFFVSRTGLIISMKVVIFFCFQVHLIALDVNKCFDSCHCNRAFFKVNEKKRYCADIKLVSDNLTESVNWCYENCGCFFTRTTGPIQKDQKTLVECQDIVIFFQY